MYMGYNYLRDKGIYIILSRKFYFIIESVGIDES